jgi:hypothetical protein
MFGPVRTGHNADFSSAAVNIFITAEEEPGLGGGLYLEPHSNLYMAE